MATEGLKILRNPKQAQILAYFDKYDRTEIISALLEFYKETDLEEIVSVSEKQVKKSLDDLKNCSKNHNKLMLYYKDTNKDSSSKIKEHEIFLSDLFWPVRFGDNILFFQPYMCIYL